MKTIMFYLFCFFTVGSVEIPMEQVDTTNSVVVKPNLQVMEPESSLNSKFHR